MTFRSKPLFVVFDSHPRPKHDEGAAFIFHTSLQKTALYLSDLFPYDPNLLEDLRAEGEGNLQWEAQLLGNVSGHYFESTSTDMSMNPDVTNAMFEANFELLAHRLQDAETKDRVAAVWKEKVQLDKRVAALREENEELKTRMSELAKENLELREYLEGAADENLQLKGRLERVAELEKLEDFWERQQSSRHLAQRREELREFLKTSIMRRRDGSRAEDPTSTSFLMRDRQVKKPSKEGPMPGSFPNDRAFSPSSDRSLSPPRLFDTSRASSPAPDFDDFWDGLRSGGDLGPAYFIDNDDDAHVDHDEVSDDGVDGDDSSDLELALRMQWQFNEEDTALREQMKTLQRQADNRPVFSCCICIDELPTDFVARVEKCGHSFCRACLKEFVRNGMDERRYPLLCPECGPVVEDSEKVGCELILFLILSG